MKGWLMIFVMVIFLIKIIVVKNSKIRGGWEKMIFFGFFFGIMLLINGEGKWWGCLLNEFYFMLF